MRGIILSLLLLMLILAWNVFAYILSDDYKFFLKKIKYQDEIVYQWSWEIDDREQLIIIDNPDSWDVEQAQIIVPQDITFLEALSWKRENIDSNRLPNITPQEELILDLLRENFVLRESEEIGESLFGITDEYPDEYREYNNAHMSFYMFSSKRYDAVKKIFEVLTFDLPISLNEVNNIGDKSFFINMQEAYDDGLVRIVFEYENYAFWLKIKKDNYNRIKQALDELK